MARPRGRDVEVARVIGRVASGRSVVVAGPMGVGKTALLDHVASRLRADGATVTEISANSASSNIPFGALTGFIDPGERVDPLVQIAAAADRLIRLAATTTSVVFIDDAQHLDISTIAVIHRVATTSKTVLMASLRSSDTAPDELADLWRHTSVERLELQPLDAAATRELVAAALHAAPGDDAVAKIAERSAGNPLFAGELVQAHLDGTTTGLTPQLVDLVEHRIAGLPPADQEQLTIVAIGQPLDIALDIVDVEAVARLEAAGLVRTEAQTGRVVVTPAHPVHSEVIRTSLTPLRRRALSRRLGAALAKQPIKRRGDALRIVTWLIDAGDRPPPELAEAAAFEAIGWLDAALADQLASMAVEDDRSGRTLFALGEVRRLAGRREDAARFWEEAFEIATDDDDIRRIALSLGQLYQLYFRKKEAMLDILTRAVERISDPAMRLGIKSDIVMNEWTGDRRESIRQIEQLLADPDCGDESAWTALSDLIWVRAAALDIEGVEPFLERAHEIERRLPPDRDGELDLVHALYANIETHRCNLDAAVRSASEFRADAAARGIACGLTIFTASQIEHLRGNLSRARTLCDDALAQLDAYDTFNARPMVNWSGTMLAAHAGDIEAASAHMDIGLQQAGGGAPWQGLWMPRGASWLARAQGDIADAIRRGHESAKNAFEGGEIGWGTQALHDVVAWGGADGAIAALERHRPHTSGAPFYEIVFDHAVAAADRSPGALANVARRFESTGARWYAAAAWANRAACATDDVEACRDASRALSMSTRIGLHPDTVELALSERQLAVATAAAAGTSSRDIADRLFLSPRTVDNHLRDVYRRLGVHGRDELSDVFGTG